MTSNFVSGFNFFGAFFAAFLSVFFAVFFAAIITIQVQILWIEFFSLHLKKRINRFFHRLGKRKSKVFKIFFLSARILAKQARA